MRLRISRIPVSSAQMSLFLAIGVVGAIASTSPAHAQALNATGYFLYYEALANLFPDYAATSASFSKR